MIRYNASIVPKNNRNIPENVRDFKREYLFIRGINKEFGYLKNKLDNLNNGLFESKLADSIKFNMERFLKGQEKGKLKDISELYFWKSDILNIIEFANEMLYDSYDLSCDFMHYFLRFYDKISFKYFDWDGNIKLKKKCNI